MERFLTIFYSICLIFSLGIAYSLYVTHGELLELKKAYETQESARQQKTRQQKTQEIEQKENQEPKIQRYTPFVPKFDESTNPMSEQEQVSFDPRIFARNLRPEMQGMVSWMDLDASILESLRYVQKKNMRAEAVSGITWADILTTLLRLRKLLPRLDSEPDLFLREFEWRALHDQDEPFMYTGYNHPTLVASRTPKKGYVPLYRMPGTRKKGVPFVTRREIANGAIDECHAIAWVKDRFEAFLLEVQGSGCLAFEDGGRTCLRYAGQNGHKYKSSRRILEDHGLLVKSDIMMQREFFVNHPEHLPLLLENPSYVFFRETKEQNAIGAMNRPLHAWQSVAVDRRKVPLGAVLAIGTFMPINNSSVLPYHAIALAQDTGGAIKGNRIDIFCGGDSRATYVSAKLDSPGPAWILLAKNRDKPLLAEK